MAEAVDQHTIVTYITNTFGGIEIVSPTDGVASGETFLSTIQIAISTQQRMPFATIVTKDYGDFDCASGLNREGVFRLNIGVSRDTFRSFFPSPSVPEQADSSYDYAAVDTLLPHPVYAPQSWVCVLNASAETFELTVKPLSAN
jgi:Family of unknown function (DUF6194)